MAHDFILKLDGIKGDSTIKGHEDQIELDSFSWGVNQQGNAHTSSGAGAGKSTCHDVSLTKLADSSSTDLALACCTGKHIAKAELFIRKAGGDNEHVKYLTIELKDVYVTNYHLSGHAGGGLATESFSLNFAEIAMDHKLQDAKGKGSSKGNMRYNVPKQQKM